MDALTALKTRRSTKPKEMGPNAPSVAELETILTIATRVPDHGKLAPWKIIVLQGEGRAKLGAIAAQRFAALYPNDATEKHLEVERQRFTRAPLVLAVLSTPKESIKAPRWEQEMSAGAVCTNILHACHALGYGAAWLSEWVGFDPAICEALGGASDDKIAGFIYIGEKLSEPEDRERPMLNDVVSVYK